MPTGARLVSALFFGAMAYVLGHLVHAALEADTGYDIQVGNMKEVLAAIGALVGWKIMGSRAGEGTNYAVQGGILSSVAVCFWGLIVFSVYEMVQESMKMKYDGAAEATVDSFRLALEYATTLATPTILAWLLICGVIGGYLAEGASKRFR